MRPVAKRFTTGADPVPPWPNVRVPVLNPLPVGLNDTATRHFCCGANCVPQVFSWENGAVTTGAASEIGAVSTLVRVTILGSGATPTNWLPNCRLSVETIRELELPRPLT